MTLMESGIQKLIEQAQKIVIIQPDNPDGDSLGSALALEQILGDMGKQPYLYCGVDIPTYLHYMSGWDRASKDLPNQFDASIIVDTSAGVLLESLKTTSQEGWVASKSSLVIDHHATEASLPFVTLIYNQPAVATGEVIYELAVKLDWPINLQAAEFLAMAILSDSLGLTSQAVTARSIHIVAELVEKGVSLSALDTARRAGQYKSPELVHYKGELLQRVEYYSDNRIATITIPWPEIEHYSHDYNPPMLVLDDMRFTENTAVAIAFKLYPDGKITGKIRANPGKGIADKLAEHFGGGGHIYASGFKITDGRPIDDIKSECIKLATKLLNKLEG